MDGLVERLEIARHKNPAAASRLARIVIVGAGFGGISAATRLAGVAADVTVMIGATTTSSSHCFIRSPPRPCRRPI